MDHIPLPSPLRQSRTEFPYRGEKWDDGCFEGYPRRRRFDISRYRFLDDPDIDEILPLHERRKRAIPFLHTWLYLGVLWDIFQPLDNCVSCLFVKDRTREDDPNLYYVTTAALPAHMRKWCETLTENGSFEEVYPEFLKRLREKQKILEALNRILYERHTTEDWKIWKDCSREDAEVLLSISLLGEALCAGFRWTKAFYHRHAILTIRRHEGDKEFIVHRRPDESSQTEDFFQHLQIFVDECGRYGEFPYSWPSKPRLFSDTELFSLGEGWCPSEVAKLSGLSPTLKCYISMICRNEKRKHTFCSAESCIEDNIDENNYKQAHTKDSCSCPLVKVPMEDVKNILTRGGVPVVTLVVDDDGACSSSQSSPCLKVTDFGSVHEFIAISHVWSDGVGNPVENSLPSCQLVRLSRLCSLLRNDITTCQEERNYFWIDTLCVPLETMYRNLAISRMNEPYQKAAGVLVIDAELLNTSIHSKQQAMCQLMLSKWSRRAWTLAEGVLARRRLHLAFQDAVFHFNFPDENSEYFYDTPLCNGLYVYCLAVASEPFSIGKNVDSSQRPGDHEANQVHTWSYVLREIWVALQYRSITREEDLVSVAALLLNVPLSNISGDRRLPLRLRSLYSHFRQVPSTVIFGQLPKLQLDNWRWAPASFDRCSWGCHQVGNVTAGIPSVIGPDGRLDVIYDGFLINGPLFSPKAELAFTAKNKRSSIVRRHMADIVPLDSHYSVLLTEEEVAELLKPRFEGDSTSFAIIIDKRNVLYGNAPLRRKVSDTDEAVTTQETALRYAALVRVLRDDREVVECV